MASFSKKGVESIIAVVLIVMITVASASAFYFWYTRIQQQAQGQTEHSTTTFLNQITTCVKLPYVSYNLLDNETEVHVQNCGTTSIKIGDGDDNVLITSAPCTFTISSQNCDICPLTIGPGELGTFKLRFNDIICSGASETAADLMADQGNIQHKITFSIDGTTTTASKDFIPGKILSCYISVSGPTSIEYASGSPPQIVCINYSKTLTSNVPQTFTISSSVVPADPVVCSVTYYEGNGCSGSEITQETMTSGTTANFSAQIIWNALPTCNVTTVLKSTDLATCSDSVTTYTEAPAP